MKKLFLLSIFVFVCASPPGAQALETVDGCYIDGGSTAMAGQTCGSGSWKEVTWSVTAHCRNTCLGTTWTAKSESVSEVSGYGGCSICPLVEHCKSCGERISMEHVEFYTEIQRFHRSLLYGCQHRSYKRASVDCYCPGCGMPTPIVISLSDSTYELTDAVNGVLFDLDGDGVAEQTAWTARGSDEGFLALDRNLNGRIDDFMEVFGNHTPQLPSDQPNGWLALAVWDDSLNGGNEDGLIDARDDIFGDLLVWVDRNHNGFSETGELFSLEQAGLAYLSLDYDSEREWTDPFGNAFRFPSTVGTRNGGSITAWDVFFSSYVPSP